MRPYLLLDRDRRIFDECEDRAEDVELLREEVERMQETEVQAFRIPSSSTVPRWPTSEPRSEHVVQVKRGRMREEAQESHTSYEDPDP